MSDLSEASEPTHLSGLLPEELFARGMHTVRMTASAGKHGWVPPECAEVARLFPNYEVLELIGRGGMGAVYKARQTTLDRFVAIKLLPLEVSTDPNFVDRFVREARAMAKLSHRNIVAVHDFGTTSEGNLFFVMEYVEGANLHEVIQRVGLTPEQAISVAGQLCAALAYAHSKGVVHRDIKPANVMIDTDSHVRVADFGLARVSNPDGEQSGDTATGTVMGTFEYMAPEQKRGMDVDHRADIYSLGVIIYEMLCRETPQGAFETPSARIGCDARIDTIVLKALQAQPERRYQSTSEIKTDIERLRTSPVAMATDSVVETPTIALRRTRVWMGSMAAVLILGAILYIANKGGKADLGQTDREPVAAEAQAVPTPVPDLAIGATEPPAPTPPPFEEATPTAPAPTPPPSTPELKMTASTPVVADASFKPDATVEPISEPTTSAPEQPESETAKWLAMNDPLWQEAYQRDVAKPFEAGIAGVIAKYLAAVDGQYSVATKAGKLDDALAYRTERQSVEETNAIRDDDSDGPPAVLRQARTTYRPQFVWLENERAQRAKALFDRYDKILAASQTALTQKERLDEALLIKARREQIVQEWMPATAPAPTPPPTVNAKAGASKSVARDATRRAALDWLFGNGGYAQVVDADGSLPVAHSAAELPAGWKGISSVTAGKEWHSAPTAVDLQHLAAFSDAETLSIANVDLGDEAFAFLKDLPDVKNVFIEQAGLTDGLVDFLMAMKKLETVSLAKCWNVTGKTFGRLARHANLRTLGLSETGIGDDAISAIARLENLQTLKLDGTGITDAAVPSLARMKGLKTLVISNTGISAEGVVELHKKLRKTQITE